MSDEEIDLKEIGAGLKEGRRDLVKFINADRFKIWRNGYKFDKWIFQIIMFGIFGLMFFVAYSNNFELNSFKCERQIPTFNIDPGLCSDLTCCKNPFYEPTDWTNREMLPTGEYGFKPGPIFNSMGFISSLLFLIGILLNHLIYNKYFFKKKGGRPKWI